ncbi:single-stranded DNA-binding protein [Staphylococcus epidermidis]|uniref:single-stranded DNA-binding protein n=1 Tax=Staphylococcus epidermidis TaxID=1282 RepID=UPI001F21CE6F|nr:single-stranded DNA-binding protein [Staphylococcus epidermidis]UJA41137.1 single-stranded DNA-binding protein [Staphylococcus epidermidis]
MNLGHKSMFQFFYNVKTVMNFWALTECISIDKAIWLSTIKEWHNEGIMNICLILQLFSGKSNGLMVVK